MILHHDLQFYRQQALPKGMGPKFVFDQVADADLVRQSDMVTEAQIDALPSRGFADNIFALRRAKDVQAQARDIWQAFYLPWTNWRRLNERFLKRFSAFLAEHYGDEARDAFLEGARRFNGAPLWRDDFVAERAQDTGKRLFSLRGMELRWKPVSPRRPT